MAAPAAAPPAKSTILAPTSITRLSGQATEIRTKVWEITMGSAVPAWLEANGPTHVTNYNFVQSAGFKSEAHLVTRRPTEASTSQLQAKHDLSDLYDLTELGRGLLKVKPNKQVRCAQRQQRSYSRSRHNAAQYSPPFHRRAGVCCDALLHWQRPRAQ